MPAALLLAGDPVETGPDSGVDLVLPHGSTFSLRVRRPPAIAHMKQASVTTPNLVLFDKLQARPSLSRRAGAEIRRSGRAGAPVAAGIGFSLKTPADN